MSRDRPRINICNSKLRLYGVKLALKSCIKKKKYKRKKTWARRWLIEDFNCNINFYHFSFNSCKDNDMTEVNDHNYTLPCLNLANENLIDIYFRESWLNFWNFRGEFTIWSAGMQRLAIFKRVAPEFVATRISRSSVSVIWRVKDGL